MHRTLTTCTATIKNCVFRKGMILPKREDGFFPEREDLPLLEVTVEMGLWYGLTSDCSNSDQDCKRGKNIASIAITASSTTVIVKTNIQPQV